MNRLEFLKELKNSLVETVQSACAPIVEDKMEKLDRSIDVLSQLQWWYVTNQIAARRMIEQKYIDGQSLLLVHTNNTIRAFAGTCPSCDHLLHIFQMDSKCKCMNCEEEFSLASSETSCLQEYPLKRRKDGFYVGLKKQKTV